MRAFPATHPDSSGSRFARYAEIASSPALIAQGIAVAHLPERGDRPAERFAQSFSEWGKAVQLALRCLTDSAGERHKIITLDRRRPRRDRTCGTLGAVMHVSGDAMLRRHSGPIISNALNWEATWKSAPEYSGAWCICLTSPVTTLTFSRPHVPPEDGPVHEAFEGARVQTLRCRSSCC